MGMVAANRVFKILDTKEYLNDSGKIREEIIKGKISFENVNFEYEKNTPVLRNISLSIKKGERIAIVGPTGSGKSTIIKLILRFFELENGKISIDNINIKDYSIKNLRSQIALVSQDIFLFADSIYNNISLFNKKITKQDVERAAKDIGILEFINSLPGGFNYNVKERGVMLSYI